MSYSKAMKHVSNHRHDKFTQPILGMPFEGLKEGEHIESYYSVATRTATGFNVRVSETLGQYKGEFKQVSEEFETEDQAVNFINKNNLDKKYKYVRIYSTEGMHISGW